VCGLNVHKRCERMVPCNCGINQKDLAQALKEMNISPDKLKPKSSVRVCVCVHACARACVCVCI